MHTADITAGKRTSGVVTGIKNRFKRKPRNHDTDNWPGGSYSFDTIDFLVFRIFYKYAYKQQVFS